MTDMSRSNSLADLRERLKVEHGAVATALTNSLSHAMVAGDILLDAKAQLKHGEWLPWLKSCGISERTAQRYIRLARNRVAIEANPTPASDLGITGALALLAVRRDSGDGLADMSAGLAERAADSAFDFVEIANNGVTRSVERALVAEAMAAIDKMEELTSNTPSLSEIINAELHDFVDRVEAGCAEYWAASAAELGLADDDLDKLIAAIDDLKAQKVDSEQITWSLVPQFLRVAGEPRPGPSPTAVLSRLRDFVVECLHRVEHLVASERELRGDERQRAS